MLRSWSGRELAWLLACCVGVPNLLGCGGQEFSAGQGSGATSTGGSAGAGGKASSGSSSGGSSGGDQSMAGSPDSGGASGSGGAGGTVSSGCACGPGQYCRDSTNDCFDCTELSRLRFSTPQRLDTLSDSNQASRFPRSGETSTDLLYSVTGAGMRYTTDFSTSAGSTVEPSMAQDSGPLLLAESVALAGDFNFVFDRVTDMGRRQLFLGQWQGGLAMSMPAPEPYNGSASDYSIAIATSPPAGTPRAYWMTDRDPNVGLMMVTALLTANTPGVRVNLSVSQNECAPEKADLSPWVSPNGETLLFSHARVETGCTTDNPDDPKEPKDIYTVLLQPNTGQPPQGTEATPLADVNGPANDIDPSFSADFCDLYFASDRDGSYALYRAHRR